MSSFGWEGIIAMEVEVLSPSVVKGSIVSPFGGDGLRMSGNEW
jgi:hypothetical protein